MRCSFHKSVSVCIFAFLFASAALAQSLKLVEKPPDPHGTPRPFRDARDVPLRTSIYFELAAQGDAKAGNAIADSLAVQLEQNQAIQLLAPGRHFAQGAAGWVRVSGKSVLVYIEPGGQLKPATRYTVHVST